MTRKILKGTSIALLVILAIFLPVQIFMEACSPITQNIQASPYTEVLKIGPVIRVRRQPTIVPSKRIALTFDDGPDARNTAKILDILKEENISATFFLVGERVGHYPTVVKRIFNEGHLIANHSQSHQDLEGLTNEEIIRLELDPTSRAVEKLTGFYPTIMRPPYGALRMDSVEYLNKAGWKIVRWSLDTFDWDNTRNKPEEIINRVLDQHHPNAIILMHCNGPTTINALPGVIHTLRDLGYHFYTVDQL